MVRVQKARVSYKAQILDTVPDEDEPRPKSEPAKQFITEPTTSEATASDLEGMARTLDAQPAAGQEPPPELYVDAGYVTNDTLASAPAASMRAWSSSRLRLRPGLQGSGVSGARCPVAAHAADVWGTNGCVDERIWRNRSFIEAFARRRTPVAPMR